MTTSWNRPLLAFVAAMAVLTAVTAVGIVADDRVLTGAPIWLKPFKFSVSFVLYAGTLAWMLSLLPRRSRLAERAAVVIVATAGIEMLIIVGQVVRGRTSHFNETTVLDTVLWRSMGTAIMVLFVAHFLVAFAVLRARFADRVSATGVRLGLGLSLLGLAAAIPMVLPSGRTAGRHPPGGGRGQPVQPGGVAAAGGAGGACASRSAPTGRGTDAAGAGCAGSRRGRPVQHGDRRAPPHRSDYGEDAHHQPDDENRQPQPGPAGPARPGRLGRRGHG